MRIMWLCNMIPGPVQQALTGKPGSGLWVDHVLSDLVQNSDHSLRVLCRGPREAQGSLGGLSYRVFPEPVMHRYPKELEEVFRQELSAFRPQVIHIWGTEYGHTLAMMKSCRDLGLLDHTVISIQGLCGIYARHYAEGLPESLLHRFSPRDLLRLDNISFQRRHYIRRGSMEAQALALSRHVIGRTPWDRACARMLAPKAFYHFCNETLRQDFYSGSWTYERCVPHSIFLSSAAIPIKGFHYLLEALPQILEQYPDTTVLVPGPDLFRTSGKARLLEQTYHRYLRKFAQRKHLTEKVRFLGHLSPGEMKENYLRANVFALPSTIENSPNSLGEAMLLGVPCVAANVGGVAAMLRDGEEGLLYQSAAPYMLAHKIMDVFGMEAQAEALGAAARAHALKTHSAGENLSALLAIYNECSKEDDHVGP